MITKELLDKPIRKRRLLISPLFPVLFLLFWIGNKLKPPLKRAGIHVITGDTGNGKTMLAALLARMFRKKGRFVVSNSDFSDDVHKIDLLDHFGDFEMKKPLTNCIEIWDEVTREFNKRLNRSNEYNRVFLPFVNHVSEHRHQGVTHIYFIGQSWDQLDIQLQNLVQKVHFVHSNLVPSFKAWLRQKKLRPTMRPTAIKYYSIRKRDFVKSDYEKYVNRKHDLKYRKPKKHKVPVPIEFLAQYRTHAFANKKINLRGGTKSDKSKTTKTNKETGTKGKD